MRLDRFILRLVCRRPPSLLEFIYIGPLVEDHGLLFISALRFPGRCLCPYCPGRAGISQSMLPFTLCMRGYFPRRKEEA
jgi:hypothetical protein